VTPSVLGSLNPALLAVRPEQADERAPLLALTTALAKGDDAAWAQFHRELGPGIFRQLLALTRGDHDLASEALQHTYLRIAKHVRPCAVEPMFLAWLRTVARTALSDCRRRRMSFWQMLQRRHADPSDKGDDVEDEKLQRALESALLQLDEADRALLEAKYFVGTPVRLLAEQRGVSPKAVESRLTRARAELRRHLLTTLTRDE
jgi:RNA polymerase sigma-70 factor, ECF subfamily